MNEHRSYNDSDYRTHYRARYGNNGLGWEECSVAYRFGYDLAQDQRNRSREWSDVEREARQRWQQRYADRDWREMRDAVLYSFELTRNQQRTGGQGISNKRNAPGDLGRQNDAGTTFSARNHMDTATGSDADE